MKKAVIFSSIFFVTLTLGYFAVSRLLKKNELPQVIALVERELPIIPVVEKPKVAQNDEAEIFWEENIERKFKIKLLETGEFHGDEISAKSGENWLGLIKENNNYFLQSTKIQIKQVHDGIVDEKEWQKTGKNVSVLGKSKIVFLLKNATKLKEGKIKTLLNVSQDENPINMANGFYKDFEYNGEKYSLRVENKTSKDEFLDKDSRLVLSNGKNTQVLASLKDGCSDCYWSLYWVGDLDQDGKLDFYFDLSNHYNAMGKTLFLSSEAEKNKVVKKVALFWTVGC